MPPRTREIPNLAELAREYQAGAPLQRIATREGIPRSVLADRLAKLGVTIRSYSAGQRARWRDATAAQAAAWLAGTRSARKTSLGPKGKLGRDELAVGRFLMARFGGFRHQVFVAIAERARGYHLDFANTASQIAVEVVHACPSGFNAPKTSAPGRERTEQLLSRGWFVVHVIARGSPRKIDLDACGEQLASYVRLASEGKAKGRHGVVWGNGKPPASCGYDLPAATFLRCPLTGDGLTR